MNERMNPHRYHHHHNHNHIYHHAIIIVIISIIIIIIIVIRGIGEAWDKGAWFAVMYRSVIVLPSEEVVKEGGRDPG